MSSDTAVVQLKNEKFFRITQTAYYIGLIGHGSSIFLFWLFDLKELMLFNAFFSTPAFALALIFNKRGKFNAAFTLAFLELLIHQILATYYLGWDIGAHYWLIYLAGLCFFNANWNKWVQYTLLFIVCVSYVAIFFYMQGGVYQLDEQAVVVINLVCAITAIIIISLLIDYFAKATKKSESGLVAEQQRTEQMLFKIEALFGQQISHEIAQQLISSEEEIKATNFDVTIMFLDIRDFTVFADSKKPSEVAEFQNIVFSDLIEIILKNHGIVLQLLGDGLMAVFGAPVTNPQHANEAIKSGFEILERIDRLSESGRIPKIRIGIGLNSGNIIAGNIGNEQRKAYSLTGKNVIIAARIESLNKTYRSQFLVSEATLNAIESEKPAHQDLGEVNLKGIEAPIHIYQLA